MMVAYQGIKVFQKGIVGDYVPSSVDVSRFTTRAGCVGRGY